MDLCWPEFRIGYFMASEHSVVLAEVSTMPEQLGKPTLMGKV
jgi:hypothetical protein